MRKLKILFLTGLIVVGSTTLLACGDDDNNQQANPEGGTPPPPPPPVGTPPPNPPPPPPPDGGPTSFPGYVQDQILNHTTSTGAPDPSTVWDPLPDDPKFAFPASFF
jgi:hypothetical protein